MHLLLCTTPDQANYLKSFAALSVFHGHQVSVMVDTPITLSVIELKCKNAKIDAIMLANEEILNKLLNSLPDYQQKYNKNGTVKVQTLDDYQGSYIPLRGIPCVVLNPPEQLMTVPYARYVFSRFIQKVTAPQEWFPQTKFSWEVAQESTIEGVFNRFKQDARIIAIDIETPDPDTKEHTINCVSYTAYFPTTHTTHTVVIPFLTMFWLAWHRKFSALPIAKVMQGGTYDAVRLLRFNVPVSHYFYDTLNLFHSWYSECPKRLDFVAAFAIREIRFWKDDGKSGNLEDYYRYNAMDGWATINAWLALILEVPDWAINNYKQEFPLVFPCIHCELEGWRVNPQTFAAAKMEQNQITGTALNNLRKMVKAPNYNPGSHVQNKLLLKILGCGDIGKTTWVAGKPIFKPSSDEVAMKKAEYRHPLNARVIGAMRDYKKSDKLDSTYFDADKMWQFNENYWRLFYRLNPAGTDTGRLASGESSFWLGYQIQNVKRGPIVKQYLEADPGWLLAEPDFEQSESRCTFYMAGEEKGIAVVESGKDFHCWNAQLFFGFKYEDLWDEQLKKCRTKEAKEIRDEPAKRTNHGANYNMNGQTMLDTIGPKSAAKMKTLLKLPATMSLKDACQYCLNIWSKIYPRVKGLYYDETVKAIELTKRLVSPLGWTRWFFGDPKSNKHYLNAAVAHGPQNLSVGIINRGFYTIWWQSIYGKLRGFIRIKAQIHDSIPYQYRLGAEWVNDEVRRILTMPIRVVGADKVERTLVIPVGMSFGKTKWSELK